jgi:hypothetical protein
MKPGHPEHRVAAVAGGLVAMAVTWAPAVGCGRAVLTGPVVTALGTCVAPVVVALIFGTSLSAGFAAGLVVAGFFFFLSGLASGVRIVVRTNAPAMILAGSVGALMAASFHLGDPFLEWGGPGMPSQGALAVLHWVNPLCGAVGDGQGIDWLRLPIMYSGFPGSSGGGLSAAQYYDWGYPTFWVQAAIFAASGLALMVLADRWAFRFPRSADAA